MVQLSKSIIEETNVQVILGDELGSNPECIKAAIRYSIDAVVAAEICRQLPSIFTPQVNLYMPIDSTNNPSIIAPMIMWWSGAMSKVAHFIQTVLENRMSEATTHPGGAGTHVVIRPIVLVGIILTL